MIEILLYVFVLLLGFPIGILLYNLCEEEIEDWERRLKFISGVALVCALIISFIGFEYKLPVILSLFFIMIVNLTIIWKSYKGA